MIKVGVVGGTGVELLPMSQAKAPLETGTRIVETHLPLGCPETRALDQLAAAT